MRSNFIVKALARLDGRDGNLTCHNRTGERVALRKAWPVAELEKWEREEGLSATGIPTWQHWCSYVFGE